MGVIAEYDWIQGASGAVGRAAGRRHPRARDARDRDYAVRARVPASPIVEEYLSTLPFVTPRQISMPKRDKRKLREVLEQYDVQCVINISRGRASSWEDGDYVGRRVRIVASVSAPLKDLRLCV